MHKRRRRGHPERVGGALLFSGGGRRRPDDHADAGDVPDARRTAGDWRCERHQGEGLDSPAGGAVYIPWAFRPLGRGYLFVRTAGDPMGLAAAVRSAAQAIDPTVPVPELQSLEDAMAGSISARRVRALPAVGFGLLALAVALVGVLATMTTLVAERRRDLAIRAALGASPSTAGPDDRRPRIGADGRRGRAGPASGAAAARSLTSLVYGVSPFDAATFAGTAAAIVTAPR